MSLLRRYLYHNIDNRGNASYLLLRKCSRKYDTAYPAIYTPRPTLIQWPDLSILETLWTEAKNYILKSVNLNRKISNSEGDSLSTSDSDGPGFPHSRKKKEKCLWWKKRGQRRTHWGCLATPTEPRDNQNTAAGRIHQLIPSTNRLERKHRQPRHVPHLWSRCWSTHYIKKDPLKRIR